MPEPSRSLVRSLLARPLLISLAPLAVLLIVLAGPMRTRLDRVEVEECARQAERLAEMLRGMSHPPADLPRAISIGARERILLLDGGQRCVFDSASGRLQQAAGWTGPAPNESLTAAPPGIVQDSGGDRQARAGVGWGEAPAGGSVVVLRSLAPVHDRLVQIAWIAVALWVMWAGATAFVALGALRRLAAERDALRESLAGLPETRVPSVSAAGNILGLERPLRDAAGRTERMIAALEDEIREREAVLHGMLEGVVALGADRRVLMINPSAERMLRVKPELGQPIAEIVRSAAFHDLIEEILSFERPGEIEFDLEGGARLRVLGDVFRGPSGDLRGVVLVMSDVTEVRRLERIRRDFVANVSHELKTPITIIQGYMETLLDEVDEDPEVRKSFIRTVAANAGRMHRIIEDLLALSRVESTGGEIERSPFDVRDLLDRCAHDFSAEAKTRGVRIETAVPAGVAPLSANEALLERAIGNLVDNAIKYGRPDTVVSLSVREEAGAVLFEVRDQGPGIDPGHLPRLFERFYRVDRGRSRELGGTGLGLALVKHIAIAHGGEAQVESRPGEGSVFRIRIPRGPADGTS
jgi:two-component system, OmpR family, phosphate regulon sensor histidine kinase PhoR